MTLYEIMLNNKYNIDNYIDNYIETINDEYKEFINYHRYSDDYKILKTFSEKIVDRLSEKQILSDIITNIFIDIFFRNELSNIYNIINKNLDIFFNAMNINKNNYIHFVHNGGNVMKYYYEKIKNDNTDKINLDKFFKTTDFDFGLYISCDTYSLDQIQYVKKILEIPILISLFEISKKYDKFYSNNKDLFINNCLSKIYQKKNNLFVNNNNEYFVIDKNNFELSFYHKNNMFHSITYDRIIHYKYTDNDSFGIKLYLNAIMKRINNNNYANILFDNMIENVSIIEQKIRQLNNNSTDIKIVIDTYNHLEKIIKHTFYDNITNLEGEFVKVNIPFSLFDILIFENCVYEFNHYININKTKIQCLCEMDIVKDSIISLVEDSKFPWENIKYQKIMNRLLFFLARVFDYETYLLFCEIVNNIINNELSYSNIFKYESDNYIINFKLLNNYSYHLSEIVYEGNVFTDDKYKYIILFIKNIFLLKLYHISDVYINKTHNNKHKYIFYKNANKYFSDLLNNLPKYLILFCKII